MNISNWLRHIPETINSRPWGSFAVAALLLVAYQLPAVVYGLDMCDAGFYLTFYDNIFAHPATVSYNFMYYLSGLLGGALQTLFPAMGLVGMRLAGLALCLATMAIAYGTLQRLVTPARALLGCALVVVAYVPAVLILNYDLVSLLLYVAAIAIMLSGMQRHSLGLMCVAGIIVGANCFSRTPNVVAVAMAVAPVVDALYCKTSMAKALRLALAFLAGTACGIVAVLGVMTALGHYDLWLGNMRDLRSIASDSNASHSLGNMIMAQLIFYAQALWAAVKIGTVVALWLVTRKRIESQWLRMAVLACCMIASAWFMWRMPPLRPVWGMCLVGCLWVVASRRASVQLKMAAWLGLFLQLAFPLGSDSGALNNGAIIAWISAPVAMALWGRRQLLPFVAVLALGCGLRLASGDIYFDKGPLAQKTATIASDRASGMLTTPERARAVNAMLAGVAPHVSASDTLLAFGSIPLANYLTRTCPAMGCSWPEQMSPAMLASRLDSLSAHGSRPAILQQKFSTIGVEWGTPSEQHLSAYETTNVYLDNRKLTLMRRFIERNGYRRAYSDRWFVLFVAR